MLSYQELKRQAQALGYALVPVFEPVKPLRTLSKAQVRIMFNTPKHKLHPYTGEPSHAENLKGSLRGITGTPKGIRGNCNAIYGNVSSIRGDVSLLSGDVSLLSGDVTNLSGCATGVGGVCSDLKGLLSDYISNRRN